MYGPRQLTPREWPIVRRIIDGRPFIVVPDGGLMIYTHGYAENLPSAEVQAQLEDLFDYAAEDQLVAQWRALVGAMKPLEFGSGSRA